MGTLTASQMATEVRIGLGGRSTSQLPDSRIFLLLNFTQQHLGQPDVYEHETLRSSENVTLTSASTYNLTSGVLAVRSVANTTQGYGLVPQTQLFMDSQSIISGGGRPSFYHSSGTSSGRTLQVSPAPSTSFQGDTLLVREYIAPGTIDDGSDTSAFETRWDEVMILGAIYRGWVLLGQPIQRDLALEAYTGAINEIKNTVDVEAKEDPNRSPAIDFYQQMRYQR